MSKSTLTRRIRDYFSKDGKRLEGLPMTEKPCQLCKYPMKVADGQIAYYHKCCRKFRGSQFDLQVHIKEDHEST